MLALAPVFRLTLLPLVLAIAACSTGKTREYEAVTPFKRVAVVRSDELPGMERLKGGQEKAFEAAGTAGTTGYLAGSALGLACGPFFWLCMPALAGAGYIVGGAGGLVYGATLDSLPAEDARRVGETLSVVMQRRDPQQAFYLGLRDAIPAHLQADPEKADILVSPMLRVINVDEDDRETIHVHFKALLLFTWVDEQGREHFGREEFKLESGSYKVEEWVADSGRKFDEFISFGLQASTLEMATYIEMQATAHGSDE